MSINSADELWSVGLGHFVSISGAPHRVEEIDDYYEEGASYRNLVFHLPLSRNKELALEFGAEEPRLWRQISKPRGVDFITVGLRGKSRTPSPSSFRAYDEVYDFAESGTPRATCKTSEGTEDVEKVPYLVYNAASSSRRIAVEEWDGKLRFYLSEGPLDLETVSL